uniref:Uncharacterized protein n=1 Tax=Rhizophora mucronata TaxID=61149 RepID=A0A2P2J1I1_RHIMU
MFNCLSFALQRLLRKQL